MQALENVHEKAAARSITSWTSHRRNRDLTIPYHDKMSGLSISHVDISHFFYGQVTRREICSTIEKHASPGHDWKAYIPPALLKAFVQRHGDDFLHFPLRECEYLHYTVFYARGDLETVRKAIETAYQQRLGRYHDHAVLDAQDLLQAVAIVMRKPAEEILVRNERSEAREESLHEGYSKGRDEALRAVKEELSSFKLFSKIGIKKLTDKVVLKTNEKLLNCPRSDELAAEDMAQTDEDSHASTTAEETPSDKDTSTDPGTPPRYATRSRDPCDREMLHRRNVASYASRHSIARPRLTGLKGSFLRGTSDRTIDHIPYHLRNTPGRVSLMIDDGALPTDTIDHIPYNFRNTPGRVRRMINGGALPTDVADPSTTTTTAPAPPPSANRTWELPMSPVESPQSTNGGGLEHSTPSPRQRHEFSTPLTPLTTEHHSELKSPTRSVVTLSGTPPTPNSGKRERHDGADQNSGSKNLFSLQARVIDDDSDGADQNSFSPVGKPLLSRRGRLIDDDSE